MKTAEFYLIPKIPEKMQGHTRFDMDFPWKPGFFRDIKGHMIISPCGILGKN